MKKLVINACFGMFDLSYDAVMLYAKKSGIMLSVYQDVLNENYETIEIPYIEGDIVQSGWLNYYTVDGKRFFPHDITRDDKNLIEVVEELKEKADNNHSNLRVIEIPDNIIFEITNIDGREKIEEIHRIWK